MKELFPGYYKRNIKEIEELWKTAIFVFDTNLLTSLYKHSKETRDAILDQIEILKDRIILPYHAAYEFNKNRYKVIFDQQALFDTFIKNINIVENEIKSVTKHPFLSKELSEEAFTLFDKLKEQVNIEKTFFIEIFKNDIIYDKISDLFFGKISEKFSDEIIEKIHEEGEKRYAAKIPPGYKDEKKVENKFGDLIIWKHIIEIGKKAPEKGIIFISDDRKEDWIWSVNGKDIGARPELAEEISKEANSNFSLLDVLSFIKLGGKFSDTQPSVKAINEIEAFKNQELLEEKRYNTYEEYYKKSNIDNWNGYIPPSTITDFNPLDPNNFLGRTTTGYDPNEFKVSSTGYNPLDPNNFLGRTTGYEINDQIIKKNKSTDEK